MYLTLVVFFTWTNRRSRDDAIVAKLDRVLANSHWMQCLSQTKAHFDEPKISDHSLIEVTLYNKFPSRPKPFKFYNCWYDHKAFLPLVTTVWKCDFQGYPMFIISQKLKRLKAALKEFNQRDFLPNLKASL